MQILFIASKIYDKHFFGGGLALSLSIMQVVVTHLILMTNFKELGPVPFPILQVKKQAQKGRVTCVRSHSWCG